METSHGTTASIRTRWAAIGAAIAVTLGAGGGFGLASATLGSGERAVFVAIEPCRLVDTRPAPDTIGPRTTPLGAGDTYNVQARGAQGNCNLPTTATGVVLNVTAVGATTQTNLRFFPTGGTAPTVSNLNPAPGAPPAPNAVTTRLANDGRFSIFNFRGTVNVIVDVAGYYTDHHHDDRYFTKGQADARYATPAALGEVASASKWISIDPLAMSARNTSVTAAFGPSAGLTMPKGGSPLAQFEFSFTVPPDHTPNTPLSVDITWHINQTGCIVGLRANYVGFARPGGSHLVGPGATSGLSGTTGAVPSIANNTTKTTYTVGTPDLALRPGDAVILGFFRTTLATADTCTADLRITGILVRYD
jgi:hypothetical protein